MAKRTWVLAVCSCLTVVLFGALTGAQAGRRTRGPLPDAVLLAVQRAFPKATITSYGRERESGVMYYEVNLRKNGNRIEVEVAPDGSIGEVEAVVDIADVPEVVVERIKRVTRDGRILRIERHERRGVGRAGRFVPLAKPRLFYEVKYVRGGRKREFTIRHTETTPLPKKAVDAIRKAFPKARIGQAERRRNQGRDFFRVKLTQGRNVSWVLVSADGVIVEVSVQQHLRTLPRPVADQVRKAATGAKVTAIERVEVRAVVGAQKTTPLEKPVTRYRAELLNKAMTADVLLTPDGKLVGTPTWKKLHDEEEDGDDDDDNDED